jgi:hypothetical protein
MILWMVKWLKDKTLVRNIFTLSYLAITPELVRYRPCVWR